MCGEKKAKAGERLTRSPASGYLTRGQAGLSDADGGVDPPDVPSDFNPPSTSSTHGRRVSPQRTTAVKAGDASITTVGKFPTVKSLTATFYRRATPIELTPTVIFSKRGRARHSDTSSPGSKTGSPRELERCPGNHRARDAEGKRHDRPCPGLTNELGGLDLSVLGSPKETILTSGYPRHRGGASPRSFMGSREPKRSNLWKNEVGPLAGQTNELELGPRPSYPSAAHRALDFG